MKKSNESVRKAAKQAAVRLWQIADSLGCSEATLTRKLRRELPEEERCYLMEIIQKLKGADPDAADQDR